MKKKNCQWLDRIIKFARACKWALDYKKKNCKGCCFFCKYRKACDFYYITKLTWRINR